MQPNVRQCLWRKRTRKVLGCSAWKSLIEHMKKCMVNPALCISVNCGLLHLSSDTKSVCCDWSNAIEIKYPTPWTNLNYLIFTNSIWSDLHQWRPKHPTLTSLVFTEIGFLPLCISLPARGVTDCHPGVWTIAWWQSYTDLRTWRNLFGSWRTWREHEQLPLPSRRLFHWHRFSRYSSPPPP